MCARNCQCVDRRGQLLSLQNELIEVLHLSFAKYTSMRIRPHTETSILSKIIVSAFFLTKTVILVAINKNKCDLFECCPCLNAHFGAIIVDVFYTDNFT